MELIPPDSESGSESLAKIVVPLDCRFSSELSEIPSFEDSPCFKIYPDAPPIPPVTVNVLTSVTVSTM